uniref:Uncharacterized protein n=1 Tax=Aotus nancymaae TaxID=37293 RepID=A0A2K5D1H2_AOTNA
MNGMHTIDERGGYYCRNLTVQELFLELTPLLSLMCIPLCFSVQPFNFQVSSYFHHHNQYGAIIYLCTCSYV